MRMALASQRTLAVADDYFKTGHLTIYQFSSAHG